MNIDTVRRMVKVCRLMAEMPVGEGWTTSSEIEFWSGAAHSTTYRYLPKIVKLGYLEVGKRGYKKGFINHYRISAKGMDFMSTFKEML